MFVQKAEKDREIYTFPLHLSHEKLCLECLVCGQFWFTKELPYAFVQFTKYSTRSGVNSKSKTTFAVAVSFIGIRRPGIVALKPKSGISATISTHSASSWDGVVGKVSLTQYQFRFQLEFPG